MRLRRPKPTLTYCFPCSVLVPQSTKPAPILSTENSMSVLASAFANASTREGANHVTNGKAKTADRGENPSKAEANSNRGMEPTLGVFGGSPNRPDPSGDLHLRQWEPRFARRQRARGVLRNVPSDHDPSD